MWSDGFPEAYYYQNCSRALTLAKIIPVQATVEITVGLQESAAHISFMGRGAGGIQGPEIAGAIRRMPGPRASPTSWLFLLY